MIKKNTSPYIIIILGFLGIIILGTVLLLLPFATVEGYSLSFIDALFTSTSAVCVTGLVPVESVATVFTLFGKIVILALIEVGGLGFITLGMFIFSLLGLKIGISDRVLIKESMNQNSLKGMVKLVRSAVIFTLIFQFVGAIVNFTVFIKDYEFLDAVGVSIFHAISAFNNAGFDIFDIAVYESNYVGNLIFNINTSLLVIIGGIGFIVIYDLVESRSWKKLKIHSKIVLKMTLILLISGTVLIKLSEYSKITWLQAMFTSVNARTAGFATVDFNSFSSSTILVVIMLFFIGASPASTGGGIKTTTFYTVVKAIGSYAKGKKPIAYNRQISEYSITKAFVLVALSLLIIVITVGAISFIERLNTSVVNDYNYFMKIVFETFSAFGTVGNSMGITKSLHWASKGLLSLLMLFGRLGPITIISLWNHTSGQSDHNKIKYLDQKMFIG